MRLNFGHWGGFAKLFNAGYWKLVDVKRATEEELARVPYVGSELARSIKRQVAED